MNILFDHQIFRAQEYGGISRYFYEIARRLSAENECKVEIFAPLHINQYLVSTSSIHVVGKKITKPPYSGHIIRNINTALTQLLVKPHKYIDIFHETYFTMADYCPRSAKRVITVYDMIHEKFPRNFSRWDKTKHIKAYAVHRADHVICISENTKQDLITLLGVPKEKISVVYLGYSLGIEKSDVKPAQVEKPFILYVGSRGGYKNFEGLLRAYSCSRLLKNEFSIVCFGGGVFSSREISLIESLRISRDKIKHVSGQDNVLASLYSSAYVFVCPSLYEGFGIPPLEAMSFGCPVVCSNTSSLPEVVGDAAELFNPTDDAHIRSALERVVSSPERIKLLVKNGHERTKIFSWGKCAHDTFNVYKKILGMNQ